MEAGSLLRSISWKPRSSSFCRLLFPNFPCYVKASSEFPILKEIGVTGLRKGAGYKGPKPKRDWVADWVSRNDDSARLKFMAEEDGRRKKKKSK